MQGTPIHRVVKGGYVQGGDVVDGTGKGKPKFHIPDESFAVKHDEPGILGMANNGDAHTGAAQFYVTLAPLPWLDGKRVAFGKVVTKEGEQGARAADGLRCMIYVSRAGAWVVVWASATSAWNALSNCATCGHCSGGFPGT